MHEQPVASSKKLEWQIVLLIVFIILPLVAVAVVGGYGFIIWIMQMFLGPPGHGGG